MAVPHKEIDRKVKKKKKRSWTEFIVIDASLWKEEVCQEANHFHKQEVGRGNVERETDRSTN